LVALSGGGGALIGAILGQGVQLHRDKTQREHENTRHDRERQDALDDERRKRREDRYVTLLTQLSELDRPLLGMITLLPEIVQYREDADDEQGQPMEPALRAIVDSAASACRITWKGVESAHKELTTAVFAAWAVASPAVRQQSLLVADWTVPLAGVQVTMLTDHDFPEYAAFGEDGPLQHMDPRAYSAHLTATLGELRDLIAELDRLLRDELRLD
jgi:hypothetical protein